MNARPRPLALYCFGATDRDLEAVLSRTVSGGVTVNNTAFHVVQEDLPFGGVGPSGMGEYHGRAGFDRFSKLKPVFIDGRWSILAVAPPYGAGSARCCACSTGDRAWDLPSPYLHRVAALDRDIDAYGREQRRLPRLAGRSGLGAFDRARHSPETA